MRYTAGSALDPTALTAESFVFAADPLPDLEPSFLQGTAASDVLRGTVLPEIFVLLDDGEADRIAEFDIGTDQMDVSAFAASLDDLEITARTNRAGDTTWIAIDDRAGETEALVRYTAGSALDPAALTAESFVFAADPLPDLEPSILQGTSGRDDFRGTDLPEIFVLLDDGEVDRIAEFEIGTDQMDVSAFAASFDDLEIVNRTRSDGSVNWVAVSDATGDTEVYVRFAEGAVLDASVLTEDSFLF